MCAPLRFVDSTYETIAISLYAIKKNWLIRYVGIYYVQIGFTTANNELSYPSNKTQRTDKAKTHVSQLCTVLDILRLQFPSAFVCLDSAVGSSSRYSKFLPPRGRSGVRIPILTITFFNFIIHFITINLNKSTIKWIYSISYLSYFILFLWPSKH